MMELINSVFFRATSVILVALILFTSAASAQDSDSLVTKNLDAIEIQSHRINDIGRLPSVQATFLFSGKKNEVIQVEHMDANVAEKNARQIFSKVPGVFVYDMDGTGNQMNISTRGLDPHRGWEFNTRLNGAITNSDMYGYPASHYSLPMEAIERIQLVRGTGSLQYGAQFGGMINYVTKQPDSTRKFVFESINTAGSFGLVSTFNSASGTIGKFKYYVYYTRRISDGYRENSNSDYDGQSFMLSYAPNKKLQVKAELARSNYLYQIPGALTDSMFFADPRQATRARNYFNPEIYIPSISFSWKVGEGTEITWLTSSVLGLRNSVMFDRPANVQDVIDPVTNTYAPRQVDIDNFNSYTSELRLLRRYGLFGVRNVMAAGIQVINNDLHRQQLGVGTTGSDFDLSLTGPGFGRDLHFKSRNVALFLENQINLTDRLFITSGVRIEKGNSDMTGTTSYYDDEELPHTIRHVFPLFGANAGYKINADKDVYIGWSQAYRPVIFKDIIPASVYERADKDLKDAYGYNLEAGFRGASDYFRWDVGVFMLRYNNRAGTLAQFDEDGDFYLFRTNIGNSQTRGAEIFAEYNFPLGRVNCSVFTSTSLFDSEYRDAVIRSGNDNINVSGNKVESVPSVISRNGLNVKYQRASISILYSYTSSSYADALNTKAPSANGSVGLVPAYGIFDFNSSFRFNNRLMLRVNVNNVTNESYFTKRPQFYPGPGVWTSDGRSVSITAGVKL